MTAKFDADCVRDGREGLLNILVRRDFLGKTLHYKIALAFAFLFGFSCAPAFAQLPSAVGWTALPVSTSLEGSGACPANNFGGDPYPFADNCQNVIRTWNGAVADTNLNRLIIWGGGHGNYFGNEIYTLNLTANPITLTRVKDPTVPTNYAGAATCVDGIPPGSPNFAPNSRESYGGLEFLPGPNRMMIFDGSLACTQGQGSANTWTIPLANLSDSSSWVHEDPTLTGIKPNNDGNGPYGNVAAYDPNSGLVFVSDSEALYTYSYSTNTYNRITSSKGFTTGIYLSGAVDPTRKLFVMVGGCSDSSCGPGSGVYVADISNPASTTQQDWTTATLADPNCAEFLSGGANPINASNPGFTFDSVAGDFVGWPNQGNNVYIMTPDVANARMTCQKLTFANGPPNSAHSNDLPNTSYGTFGRFRYFPGPDVFVLINDWNIPAYILRLRGSTSADFTLAATPSSASVTPGNIASYTVSVGAVDGFSGSVSLAVSGLPAGASAAFNPASVAAGTSSTLTVTTTSSTPIGSSTLTITGTSGSLTHTSSVALSVTGAPGFTVSITPSSASVTAGGGASYSVSVAAVNGFSGSVNLSVSGLPAGASGNFATNPVGAGASSTLGVTTTTATAAGTYSLTITGSSSGLTATTRATLVVTSAAPPPPPPAGAITFVQGTYSVPRNSVNPVSATFRGQQTSGDLNVVVIGWADTVATVSSVSDTAGNTYVLASGPTMDGTNATQSIYYAKNIFGAGAGTNTVTVIFSVPAAFPDLRILEYAGADQSNPLDSAGGAAGTSTDASAFVTTTNADDQIVAGDFIEMGTTGAGTGFTSRMITSPNSDMVEDESVTAAGMYVASAPLTTSGWWVMNVAAFRVASSGSQPPPPPPPTSNATFVQGAFSTPQGSVPSVTATFTGAQTGGDLNIVVIGWNDTTATVRSVEDFKGNVYTLAVGPTQISGIATQSIYYATKIVAAAPGANTVRVSFIGSATSPSLRIAEYTGVPATNPIDAIGSATGTSATASATLTTATTNANDLIFASDFIQTTTTGPGPGFTSRMVTTPESDIVEDEAVASTGSFSASALLQSGWWIMQVVAIK